MSDVRTTTAEPIRSSFDIARSLRRNAFYYGAVTKPELRALTLAYEDAVSALVYIERRYGRLDGVGWDRVLPPAGGVS